MQSFAALIGRILLAAIFLGSVANKFQNMDGTKVYMNSADMPYVDFMLWGAIVFELLGGMMLLLGYKTRFGVSLLLIFVVLATYYFHMNFEGEGGQKQMIMFMKNLAIMGGLFTVLAHGPGDISMDGKQKDRH